MTVYTFFAPLLDNRSRRRGIPWMTVSLVLINVIIHTGVHFFVYEAANDPTRPFWAGLYPFMEVPYLIINREGLGALSSLTSTYLHGSWMHLFNNMFLLAFFGRKVEDTTGPFEFFMLYTLCGFTSSLLSVIANFILSGGPNPGLGASGAVYGIMAAYLFLYSGQKVWAFLFIFFTLPIEIELPLLYSDPILLPILVPIPIRFPIWIFIIFLLMNDVIISQAMVDIYQMGKFFFFPINVFAHLGGFMGGIFFTYLFINPYVLSAKR